MTEFFTDDPQHTAADNLAYAIRVSDPFQDAVPCWQHPQSDIGTMTRLYS